jgi:hypothetical protein
MSLGFGIWPFILLVFFHATALFFSLDALFPDEIACCHQALTLHLHQLWVLQFLRS